MNKSAKHFRACLCLFIGIVFSTMLHAQSIDQLIKKLDKSIDSLHAIHEFNGNILLVKNGVKLYEKSIGFTDSTSNHALTISSAFNLASISKTFTSSLVLMYVQEGKLKIDDQVHAYLPNFPYKDITIRHFYRLHIGVFKFQRLCDF